MTEEKNKNRFRITDYRGDRIRIPVNGCMNIRRTYRWSQIVKKYLDPNGLKFEARRSVPNSKKIEVKHFDVLQDARDWQLGRNFSSVLPSQFGVSKNLDGYLVQNLLNDWQRLNWSSLRESTKINYQDKIMYLEPLLKIPVESLTPRMIDEWLIILKHPDMVATYKSTRVSFEKELKVLKSILSWYIDINDDTKMVNPVRKRHKLSSVFREKKVNDTKYLTEVEYFKFLDCLKDYSIMFWALAITQQAQVFRISEVAAMKWQNLDLANRTYRVSEHVMWARVTGRQTVIAPGTKTNKAGESFYSPLRQMTLEALAVAEELRFGDLIFHDKGEIIKYRQIQYAYDMAFKKAGLSHRSTHVLRHTGATLFLEESGDILAVQQLGNWKDQKMAQHYSKVLGSRARHAIDKSEQRAHLRLISGEKKTEVI